MTTESAYIPDGWTHSTGYAARYQREEQVSEVTELLRLETADVLLDIGCGNGAFSVAAAAEFPDCRVWAFDALGTAVTECRRRASEAGLDNLRVSIAPADKLPFENANADRVLMRNVLHHVASADDVIREIARVLRPRGLALLEGPANVGDESLGSLISEIDMMMDDSHRRTYLKPDVIMAELLANGMTTETMITWPFTKTVSAEQRAIIIRQQAEDLSCLQQEGGDRWTIQFNIVRIIARKEN